MHKTMTLSDITEDVMEMFKILDINITKEEVVDLLALAIENGEARNTHFSYHGKYRCPALVVMIGCLKNEYTILQELATAK